MALFEASGLTVAAGGSTLLSNLDLSLSPGELVAVVGPSGSGKTTLLRALAMLTDPVVGDLALHGRTPAQWGFPTWRRRVGLVAQRPVLLDDTVRANLARPFRYRTSDRAFSEDAARRLLETVGLRAARLDQNALSLSEGQQQRVSLVRSLLVEPEVLLLDEPTSALDAEAVQAVEGLVRERVRGRDAAGLVVTHDRAQAERWCDRIVDVGRHVPGEGDRA